MDTLCDLNGKISQKVRYVGNPYDIDEIENQGRERINDYEFDGRVIVSSGRLVGCKNFARLIKSFFIVKKYVKDTKLLIIGEGEERTNLENIVKLYALEKDVTILGFR